jgi:hypothetical protein
MMAKIIAIDSPPPRDASRAVATKRKAPPAIIPAPITFTDESSFRLARREWEMLMCCDKKLTPTARVVGIRLASHAGYDAFAFPSAKTLAMDLGIGERTVKTALRQLRERGWITKLRRLGFSGPMAYALSTDAEIEHAIKIRLEGNKAMRDFARLRRQTGC